MLNRRNNDSMKEPGFIYILVNPSMDGFVKIGKTTREPEARAKDTL